jgi:hypothetical protein
MLPGRWNRSAESSSAARVRLALVGRDGAHQRGGSGGVEHRGHVLNDDGLQRAMQIGPRVAFASAGSDAVPEHLAGRLSQRVGGLVRAAGLDAPQRVQQQRCRDVLQWQAADPGE